MLMQFLRVASLPPLGADFPPTWEKMETARRSEMEMTPGLFNKGDVVVIAGLLKNVEHNGKRAIVQCTVPEGDRIHVCLEQDGEDGGGTTLRIRLTNVLYLTSNIVKNLANIDIRSALDLQRYNEIAWRSLAFRDAWTFVKYTQERLFQFSIPNAASLRVGPSPLHGRGVFATANLPPHEVPTLYPADGVTMQHSDAPHLVEVLGGADIQSRLRHYATRCGPDKRWKIFGDPERTDDPVYLGHMMNDAAGGAFLDNLRPLSLSALSEGEKDELHEAMLAYGLVAATCNNVQTCDRVHAPDYYGPSIQGSMTLRCIPAGCELLSTYGLDYWLGRFVETAASVWEQLPPGSRERCQGYDDRIRQHGDWVSDAVCIKAGFRRGEFTWFGDSLPPSGRRGQVVGSFNVAVGDHGVWLSDTMCTRLEMRRRSDYCGVGSTWFAAESPLSARLTEAWRCRNITSRVRAVLLGPDDALIDELGVALMMMTVPAPDGRGRGGGGGAQTRNHKEVARQRRSRRRAGV
ncbi:MAG: hypothetical protein GY842_12425 [bacterium]|nr:hypothetical protein [bacterium]